MPGKQAGLSSCMLGKVPPEGYSETVQGWTAVDTNALPSFGSSWLVPKLSTVDCAHRVH